MPVRCTPPMLDRTDFESWQQRIRLYCWKKLMESKSHNVQRIEPVAIIDRQLPFEYSIATDVTVMAQPVQNINHSAFRSMFEREKLSDTNFIEGKPVGAYILKMKGYVEQLERLSYVLPQDFSVGLITNGLTSDFAGFVRNYNMHNMGKTIGELHALLIEYE
ncbi:hypothetical protein Tco_0178393 [Tanacetum coccineum]